MIIISIAMIMWLIFLKLDQFGILKIAKFQSLVLKWHFLKLKLFNIVLYLMIHLILLYFLWSGLIFSLVIHQWVFWLFPILVKLL